MKIYANADITKGQMFVEYSMTSEVNEGHIRQPLTFLLRIPFLLDICFV